MVLGLWRISLATVGLLLALAAPARAQPLLFGDSNLDGVVNLADAEDALGVLLTGDCRLGNLGVNEDDKFNIKDVAFIGQYARGARAATDLSGSWSGPPVFLLSINSGNSQGVSSPGLSGPMSTAASHLALAGLCLDKSMLKQEVEIIYDATGGASIVHPDPANVGFDASGTSDDWILSLAGGTGIVFIRATVSMALPDLSFIFSEVATFALWGADCGNGVVEPGEQCDLGDGNGQPSNCCSLNCQLKPSTSICRPAEGLCDEPEYCNGSSAACPADQLMPAGTFCASAPAPCYLDGYCNGISVGCGYNIMPDGTPCGYGSTCQGGLCGGFIPEICWPNGVLDTGEECDDGALNNFPGSCCDSYCRIKQAGQVCRPSTGPCDAPDVCNASGFCPADDKVGNGVVCRSSGGICDTAEQCDGTANTCPTDSFLPSGTVCRSSTGVCDAIETCSGVAATCQADQLAPAGTVCRPSIPGGSVPPGTCDPAEVCDGVSASCPANYLAPNGTFCDDGIAPACNNECWEGSCVNLDSVCGDGIATCGEQCDDGPLNGTTPCGCQTDCQYAPAGTSCGGSSAGCDALDTCNGVGTCVDNVDPAGTVCLAASGVCDADDVCNGANTVCAPLYAPAGTMCRADLDGGYCDAAEYCNGVSSDCPADMCEPAGSPCSLPFASTCDASCFCGGDIFNTAIISAYTSASQGYTASGDQGWGVPDPGPGTVNGSHLASAYPRMFMAVPNDQAATRDRVYVSLYDPYGGFTTPSFSCTVCGAAATIVITSPFNAYAYAYGPDLNGISTGTGVYGAFASSQTFCAASCNYGIPSSANFNIYQANAGVLDTTAPAAGGAVNVDLFGYCPTGQCDTVYAANGWGVVTWIVHFDPARLTPPANCTGAACVAVPDAGAGTPYGYPVGRYTVREILNFAPGKLVVRSDINFLQWKMAHLTRLPFTALPAPAGTVTLVDVSQWSSAPALINSSSTSGGPVNGSSDYEQIDLPVTNKTGRIRFQ